MRSLYRDSIAEVCKVDLNRARLIEAYLRCQYGTLDALSRHDIWLAYESGGIGCAIDTDPALAESLAQSFGLGAQS